MLILVQFFLTYQFIWIPSIEQIFKYSLIMCESNNDTFFVKVGTSFCHGTGFTPSRIFHTHVHTLASDALPTRRQEYNRSIVLNLRDTYMLNTLTSDRFLPGQVNDNITGDLFAGHISSAWPIELDAKSPQRRHLGICRDISRFLSSWIEVEWSTRIFEVGDTRCNRDKQNVRWLSTNPLATLVPHVLTDCQSS